MISQQSRWLRPRPAGARFAVLGNATSGASAKDGSRFAFLPTVDPGETLLDWNEAVRTVAPDVANQPRVGRPHRRQKLRVALTGDNQFKVFQH